MFELTLMLVTAASAALAAAFGYAAQRGSICAVKGIDDLISHRSPRAFLGFLRTAVWVALVSIPFAWAGGRHLAPSLALTLPILAGSFLFGIGAALNGGCSFATVLRLAGGDLSFLLTLAGLSLGYAAQHRFAPQLSPAAPTGPSPLATPDEAVVALMAVLLVWAIFELRSARVRSSSPGKWTPERTAVLTGLSAGLLYALHGSWMYTAALDRGLAGMMRAALSDGLLAFLFLAMMGGAALAARQLRGWRAHISPSDSLVRFGAGALMGFGAALIPGGNDVLILHAIPALSAHAVPAYFALVCGVAVTLILRNRLFTARTPLSGTTR